MKKRFVFRHSLLCSLIFCMLLALLFTACQSEEEGNATTTDTQNTEVSSSIVTDTTEATEATQKRTEETTAKATEPITEESTTGGADIEPPVVENPNTVCITMNADAVPLIRIYANQYKDALETLGYDVQISNDPTAQSAGAYEIYLADVDCKMTNDLLETLGGPGWGMQKEGNKLCVAATNSVFLETAMENLLNSGFSSENPFANLKNAMVNYQNLLMLYHDGKLNVKISSNSADSGVAAAISSLKSKLVNISGDQKTGFDTGAVTVEFLKIADGSGIAYNSYSVVPVGNTIMILSKTDKGLLKGVDELYTWIRTLSNFDQTKTLVYPAGFSLSGAIDPDLPMLPALQGALLYDADLSGSSYTIAVENTTKNAFDAYVKQIESDGYTLVSEKAMDYSYIADDTTNYNTTDSSQNQKTNYYRTYINDLHMVHMYYCEGNGNIRVIGANIETYQNYLAAQQPEQGNSQSLFAMLDIGGQNATNASWVYAQGLSLVYKLNDGRFIVVDGGQWSDEDTVASEVTRLYNWMLEHSDNGKVVIAAWLFTHNHSDHINIAWKFELMYGDIAEIQSFMYNFPTMEYVLSVPGNNLNVDYYSIRYPRMESLLSRYNNLVVHSGMSYQFANATIEILYTHEDYYPRLIKSFNNSNTVYKITIDGISFLVAGDLEEPGQKHCITQTGTKLDSDYIQLTHHGYNGQKEFYMYGVNGKTDVIALWPHPTIKNTDELINRLEANQWLYANAKENYFASKGIYLYEFKKP